MVEDVQLDLVNCKPLPGLFLLLLLRPDCAFDVSVNFFEAGYGACNVA
jgi:hypothetical protein